MPKGRTGLLRMHAVEGERAICAPSGSGFVMSGWRGMAANAARRRLRRRF